jgi:hypothetical protein
VKIQIDNCHRDLRTDLFLSLIVFGVIWGSIFTTSGILNAGFNYFIDDHEILVIHNVYTSFYDVFVEPFTALFSSEPKSRFRPIYDVLLRLCTKLYGLNPFIWYLSSLLVAIATSTIFYLVGRLQKFSQIESIGFAGLIVLGQQASTYTRFGTPETAATLFVALSFLFGSLNSDQRITQNIYNCLFIIFSLLAALNKEACILMLPGLAYFKIWHLSRSNNISLRASFLSNKFNVIFIVVWFILSITYIKIAGVTGPGYAGIDGDTLSILGIFNSLLSNGAIFGSALIANIGYYFSRKDRNKFQFNNFYTLTALIIIPQLIIYNKTGMLWHYILPGAVGVSFLAFYPMRQIAQRSKKTCQLVISKILIILLLQLIFTTNYFSDISKRTTPIQGMISDLSRCVDQNAPLAIIGNSYVDYETLTAFYKVTDLLMQNHQTFLATYGSKNADLSIDILKAQEQPWYFLNPQPALKKYYQGKIIDRLNPQELMNFQGIVLTHSSKIEKSLVELNLDWFQIDRFAKKYYSELDISIYCKKDR